MKDPASSPVRPGRCYLVTSEERGREVFLGRPVVTSEDEPPALQGKLLTLRPEGLLLIRPFLTTLRLSSEERDVRFHELATAATLDEAQRVLDLGVTHLERAEVPHLFGWIRAAAEPSEAVDEHATDGTRGHGRLPLGAGEPFPGLLDPFFTTAEEFRRALFQSRQVESSRELDQVVELEGDLWIEMGRATNQAVVKLHRVLQSDRELAAHMEAVGHETTTGQGVAAQGGWPFLHERLEVAKSWARSHGRSDLVLELHRIVKDTVFALNEILFDHAEVLDTLITETFAQYDIHPVPVDGSAEGVLQPLRRTTESRDPVSSSSPL